MDGVKCYRACSDVDIQFQRKHPCFKTNSVPPPHTHTHARTHAHTRTHTHTRTHIHSMLEDKHQSGVPGIPRMFNFSSFFTWNQTETPKKKLTKNSPPVSCVIRVCMCVRVRACVRACVRVCVCCSSCAHVRFNTPRRFILSWVVVSVVFLFLSTSTSFFFKKTFKKKIVLAPRERWERSKTDVHTCVFVFHSYAIFGVE